MNKNIFAKIIFPIATDGFTYEIPEQMQGIIKVGMRVLAPLGKRKIQAGIVISINNEIPAFPTKPIYSILDEKFTTFEKNIEFWLWLASYYMCTPGEVMKAALPALLKMESRSKLYANRQKVDNSNAQEDFIRKYVNKNPSITIEQLSKVFKLKSELKIIQNLLNKKVLFIEEEIKSDYKNLTQSYIKLNAKFKEETAIHHFFEQNKRAPAQKHCLEQFLLLGNGDLKAEISQKKLLKHSNNSISALRALIKKEIFQEFQKKISRVKSIENKLIPPSKLNEYQQTAFNEITNIFQAKKVCLLHGVTSSGKTEIYIQLIQNSLTQNKQILYLLPEIGLTNQIVTRLSKHFGRKIAVYHSAIGDAERYEIWQELLKAEESNIKIILGVRSSIFLPYSNLGLIIVDEEHESTYKQYNPAPRYQARDAAIILAQQQEANILLGSATPSVESYFNALSGKFGLVELSQRYKDKALPEIRIINMVFKSNQLKHSILSRPLMQEIGKALSKEEQIILFRNRRGFSPILQCADCGHIPKCKHCDVSMTYHKNDNLLICHYCGYSIKNQGKCSNCNSNNLQMLGYGTQRVEEELEQKFSDYRIGRMDVDTMNKKNAYRRIIEEFENQNIQILVGTQILAKGLDFEHVNTVGILDADAIINLPDFRSHERAFQLLTQVSGRAGRHSGSGKVLLQTRIPAHPVVRFVSQNDYKSFINNELNERKQFQYPPFSRMLKLTILHNSETKVNQFSFLLANILKKKFKNNLLGPIIPYISRIQRKYQMQILIKLSRNSAIVHQKNYIKHCIQKLKQQEGFSSVQVIMDVDPYN